MTWYHVATGAVAGSLLKQFGVDPYTPWYVDVAGDTALIYLSGWKRTRPYIRALARHTGRSVHVLARATAKSGYRVAARAAGTRAAARFGFLTGTAALYTSALAVGYTIGAVIGTGVSQVVFGDQGARHALDFYTGKGKYGEYFDIVGNFNTVYNALKQGDI